MHFWALLYLTNAAKAPGWYCEAGFGILFWPEKAKPPNIQYYRT